MLEWASRVGRPVACCKSDSRLKRFGEKLSLALGIGNSLVLALLYALVAQLDRASDYESEGWGFDSLRVHQFSGRQNLVSCAETSPAQTPSIAAAGLRRGLFPRWVRLAITRACTIERCVELVSSVCSTQASKMPMMNLRTRSRSGLLERVYSGGFCAANVPVLDARGIKKADTNVGLKS